VVSGFYVLPPEKQIPGDPWTVVFGVEFEDSGRDLGSGGHAEFFLNANEEPAAQELDSVFRQSGLVTDASAGAFWVTLRFAEETVEDGTNVRLGLQLIDAGERRSNCFTLELEFDVFPATQARLLRSQRRARCAAAAP
jgi:hypothetical protein